MIRVRNNSKRVGRCETFDLFFLYSFFITTNIGTFFDSNKLFQLKNINEKIIAFLFCYLKYIIYLCNVKLKVIDMEINKVISVINNSNTKKFRIKFEDGTKEEMRLFVYCNDTICRYRHKSVRFGYPVSTDKWITIQPINSADINTKVKNFMQNVVKYLNESGLWVDIKESFEKILEQGDDYLNHVLSLDWSEQRQYMNETIGTTFHVDSIVRSALKGIISINYERYDKDYIRERAKNAIKNNESYSHSWRKRYDNSIEFRLCDDGKKRGWYSEEFKNCGNGHYYLALDERRAIFCEDD